MPTLTSPHAKYQLAVLVVIQLLSDEKHWQHDNNGVNIILQCTTFHETLVSSYSIVEYCGY